MTAMTAARSADPFSVEDLVGAFGAGCRYEVAGGSLLVTRDEPFTVADVEALPDDERGRRYELLDGVLLVTPAPVLAHQRMLGALHVVMRSACPPDLEVLLCAGYEPDARNSHVPDLFVARREDLAGKYLYAAPLLVAEVASPSTARIDRGRKRAAYAARGVASYWLLDPREPSVTVLELRGGRYDEVGVVAGDRELVLDRPYPLRIVPAELIAGLPGRREDGHREARE